MKKLISLLKKLDNNIVKILFIGFIFLAPLYPKLPIRMINYTYIAIRMEDFYIAIFGLIFLIQILRKKINLNKPFFLLIVLFWLANFASFFYGYYVQKTIIIQHLGFLHALRRVEYMFIFFVATSLVRSKEDLFYYLKFCLFVLFLVVIYGIGQKFLGWPAVQTMNPEYAKGYLLFLTPEARISSTFAGHYDLASYLIFMMPIVLGYFFFRNQIKYFLLFCLSIFALVLTASRISYGAYIASSLIFLLVFKKFKYFLIALVITALLTVSSKNLTSRISRTFQVKQIYVNQETGQVVVPQVISTKELPAGSYYIPIKNKGGASSIGVNDLFETTSSGKIKADKFLVKQQLLEDIRWEASRSGRKLSQEEEDRIIASIAASLKPINTIVSDISFATRIQTEWPRAIRAFMRNPILGLGPSAITEATDNDYLRWLGETGLVGTGLFLALLFMISKRITQSAFLQKNGTKILYFGYIFALLGLMINATYIDVFEASKMAFQYWIITGMFVGSIALNSKVKIQKSKVQVKIKNESFLHKKKLKK
jgi:hypothetical protein